MIRILVGYKNVISGREYGLKDIRMIDVPSDYLQPIYREDTTAKNLIIKNENNADSVDISLKMDGTSWCAMIGETSESQSIMGFGETIQDALSDLIQEMNSAQQKGGKL